MIYETVATGSRHESAERRTAPLLWSKEPKFELVLSQEYQITLASLISEAATIDVFNRGSCGAHYDN